MHWLVPIYDKNAITWYRQYGDIVIMFECSAHFTVNKQRYNQGSFHASISESSKNKSRINFCVKVYK